MKNASKTRGTQIEPTPAALREVEAEHFHLPYRLVFVGPKPDEVRPKPHKVMVTFVRKS